MMRLLRRAALRAFGTLMPDRAAAWYERVLLTPRRMPPLDVPKPETTGQFTRLPYGTGWLSVCTWGHGPAVLLVHGWGGSMASMNGFIDPLVRAGHRVVSFDLPAHGHSDGERTSVLDAGGAILQVGRHVGPLAGIITHSFGGPATALAMGHGLTADRVVMLAPPRCIRDVSRPVGPLIGLPQATSDRMLERFARRLRFRWEEIQTDRLVSRLEVPLLVVHDEEDPVVPWSHGAAVARAARVGRLVTTAGLGHRELLLDPSVRAEILQFLVGPVEGRKIA